MGGSGGRGGVGEGGGGGRNGLLYFFFHLDEFFFGRKHGHMNEWMHKWINCDGGIPAG